MKLRIKGDSLRLRLTRTEVERFATEHRLAETMRLVGGALTYELCSDSRRVDAVARLDGSRLTVVLPRDRVNGWAGSDAVSLRGSDGPLNILVEKDFACLKPREGEDDTDAFPHPESTVES